MKKVIWILIIGIALTGCKKKKEEARFDRNVAEGITPAVAMGISQMFSSFYNPGSHPYSLKYFQGDCVDTTGDVTDFDDDGYVKDAAFNFNCEFSYPPNTYKIKGKVIVKDYDDNDPKSGFYVKIEDFEYTIISGAQSEAWMMNSLYDIKQISPEIKGRIEYSFTYQAATIGWGADFTYAPDDPEYPWKGGTLNFEGYITADYQNEEYNLSMRCENLHYSENSNCQYPDSGKITITDGKNYLVIEFNCNTYAATYNGSPIAGR